MYRMHFQSIPGASMYSMGPVSTTVFILFAIPTVMHCEIIKNTNDDIYSILTSKLDFCTLTYESRLEPRKGKPCAKAYTSKPEDSFNPLPADMFSMFEIPPGLRKASGGSRLYRLVVKLSKFKVHPKFLSINALSASHHYIGEYVFTDNSRCPAPEYAYPAWKGAGTKDTCTQSFSDSSNSEYVQDLDINDNKAEIAKFVLDPEQTTRADRRRNFDPDVLFHVNVKFSPENLIVLGLQEDGQFEKERNRFVFILFVQEGDAPDKDGTCYANLLSPIFSLKQGTESEALDCKLSKPGSNFELPNNPDPYRSDGTPKIAVSNPIPKFSPLAPKPEASPSPKPPPPPTEAPVQTKPPTPATPPVTPIKQKVTPPATPPVTPIKLKVTTPATPPAAPKPPQTKPPAAPAPAAPKQAPPPPPPPPPPKAPVPNKNPVKPNGKPLPPGLVTVDVKKIEGERELCPYKGALLDHFPTPKCASVYPNEGKPPVLSRFSFKFYNLGGKADTYRVVVIANKAMLRPIKFLAISALTVSRHYVGKFTLDQPCETKSYAHYTMSGGTCARHPSTATEVPIGGPIVASTKIEGELKTFEAKESTSAKGGSHELHINVLFSDNDQILLGWTNERSNYAPERNQFTFIISMQEWDNDKDPGLCYFNHRSPIFSLGEGPNMMCEIQTSSYTMVGVPPFDKDKNPIISQFEAITTTTTTTTSTTESTTTTKTTIRQAPPHRGKVLPFPTIETIIKDPNALIPPYVPPKETAYAPPSDPDTAPKKDSKKKELTMASIFNGCGRKKGCVGDPSGCVETRSCSSLMTYSDEDYRVRFEIMGKAMKYVALGLSFDRAMGNDSVVECVREYRTQISAYMSWNFPNRKNSREEDHSAISDVRGVYKDGHIICEFWRTRRTVNHGVVFDLGRTSFYILHARGNTAGDGRHGNIGYHGEGSSASSKPYSMHDRFRKTRLTIVMETIHGATMIFAWFFCFPLSAFMARYFKETFKEWSVRGYTVWYAWHVIIAWVGLLCVLIGVIAMFAGVGLMTKFKGSEWNFHSISGLILIAVMFVEPISGYAVKVINRRKSCQVMNYVHGVFGHLSFQLAFWNIYYTTSLEGGLPCVTSGLIITWMVFYVLLHIFMSYMVCYVDFVQGERVSRAYNCCLLRTAPHPLYEDVTGSPVRKMLLGAFVLCFSVITAVITLLFVFSTEDCLEEQDILGH